MTGGVAILIIATLVAPALVLDGGTATARFAIADQAVYMREWRHLD